MNYYCNINKQQLLQRKQRKSRENINLRVLHIILDPSSTPRSPAISPVLGVADRFLYTVNYPSLWTNELSFVSNNLDTLFLKRTW